MLSPAPTARLHQVLLTRRNVRLTRLHHATRRPPLDRRRPTLLPEAAILARKCHRIRRRTAIHRRRMPLRTRNPTHAGKQADQ